MKWTEISYHLISRFKFSSYVSFTFPVEMKYRYHRVVVFRSLWHYELSACTSCMKKLFFKTNSGVPPCWVMKHKRLVLSPEFIWRRARRAVGFRCSKFPHFLNMSVSVCPIENPESQPICDWERKNLNFDICSHIFKWILIILVQEHLTEYT